MMEYRCRSKRTDEWVDTYKGAMVNPEMLAVKLEGPAKVLKPNGKPLAIYLPGAALEVGTECYSELTKIRSMTDNRGYASGGDRMLTTSSGRKRTRAPVVMSSILGSFEAVGGNQYCRLTAFTARHDNEWRSLMPYFDRIAALFKEHVPDRYAAQMEAADQTNPDWIVPGTPFSTITVNNTYPTGIHTDKGDLDAGFSTLGVVRRGEYEGGWLTFPQYGVAVDMQDGDVLLMDAHEWHGNTAMTCARCGETLRKPGHACEPWRRHDGLSGPTPERISVVSYFRTAMTTCGSLADENARRAALLDGRNARKLGLEEQDAPE
jgi:Oxygenase domain of the 2OGFeDO superfamily